MKLSVNRNLQLGFGLSLLLLIISSAASYFSIQNLLSSSQLVRNTNRAILEMESVISIMRDAETGQRGYLLTGDKDFLESTLGASANSQIAIKRIKVLTDDVPVQKQNTLLLEKLVKLRLDYLNSLVIKKDAGEAISVASLKTGKNYMDKARLLVNRCLGKEETAITSSKRIVNNMKINV